MENSGSQAVKVRFCGPSSISILPAHSPCSPFLFHFLEPNLDFLLFPFLLSFLVSPDHLSTDRILREKRPEVTAVGFLLSLCSVMSATVLVTVTFCLYG